MVLIYRVKLVLVVQRLGGSIVRDSMKCRIAPDQARFTTTAASAPALVIGRCPFIHFGNPQLVFIPDLCQIAEVDAITVQTDELPRSVFRRWEAVVFLGEILDEILRAFASRYDAEAGCVLGRLDLQVWPPVG